MSGSERFGSSNRRRRSGKVLVALALALPAVVSLAAFAICLANLQRTHSQLSAVVDAAASSAIDTYNMTRSSHQARDSAQRVASHNEVQGQPLVLEDTDIEFGRYEKNGETWEFSSNERRPNAVRVIGRVVDDGRSGPARLLQFLKTEREVTLSRTSIATQLDRDIALVVDRSSAGAFVEDRVLPPDPADLPIPRFAPRNWTWCLAAPLGSRFRSVMRTVVTFILELTRTSQREQLALVSFADEAIIDTPLTLDYSLVTAELWRLANAYCGGVSNKEDGINHGVQALTDPATARPDALKLLILISDSPYDEGDAVAAAAVASQRGIVVHTISYGPNVDQTLMRDVATAGDGRHWHATRASDISNTLRRIARSMPTVVVPE